MANKLRNTDYPLTELHRSGYEVADGYPDIRGWNILNGVGQKIGEVVELIFDPLSNSVRYLVVHIEGKPINLLSRDVLIPIGLAELVEETGIVSVPNVTLGHLALLPTYKRSKFNRAFERTVRGIFSPETENETGDETDNPVFYEHDHFNQDRFYYNRNANRIKEENEAGLARIRERIVPKQNSFTGERDLTTSHTGNDFEPFKPYQDPNIDITEPGRDPMLKKERKIVEEERDNQYRITREETGPDTEKITGPGIKQNPKTDFWD